jgi:translocation and assembly module TamB
LVRGQVSVVGKTFKLDSGTVTLPPGDEISPEIDVVAIHSGVNLETTVQIAGPVANPEITFSSVPDLPQDEIIAKMLFNKSAAGLSPIEAVQLAAALAELTGGGGGGVTDFARKTLGVDVLRVDSDDTESDASPALNVGKYVTDGVYVGVKQGITPESSSVSVEVEITPNISVDSNVRQNGASETGVKFKLDY